MKTALYPNFQKKNALGCAREACDILLSAGIDVYVSDEFKSEFADKSGIRFESIDTSAKTADFVIAIGGDGTILRCAKYLMGTGTKLLGINTGTLGFMAGLESDQLEKLIMLKTGGYVISERMTLDIKMPDGTVYTALNDLCAKTSNSKICDFEVSSDGYLIGKYRADGVIFSTPSGSTAYALSAGGPVMEPDLECIEMTLICPHSLFSRATLFSSGRTLRLKNTCRGNGMTMNASVDGEAGIDIPSGAEIELRKGRYKISFVDLIGNSFHESLCRKMMKPIK